MQRQLIPSILEGCSRKPNPCRKCRNHSNSDKLGKAKYQALVLVVGIFCKDREHPDHPLVDGWGSGYPCKINHDEYCGYYSFPPSLYPMTDWATLGLRLPPICLQIILASCLRAGTQKFPEVCIKSLLSHLAFLVGIIFLAGSL